MRCVHTSLLVWSLQLVQRRIQWHVWGCRSSPRMVMKGCQPHPLNPNGQWQGHIPWLLDLPSTAASPFVRSEGLPPVAEIQKGGYVDMAELLCDNMEWEYRQLTSDSSGSKSGRASRREAPDLLCWITYFGILCQRDM